MRHLFVLSAPPWVMDAFTYSCSIMMSWQWRRSFEVALSRPLDDVTVEYLLFKLTLDTVQLLLEIVLLYYYLRRNYAGQWIMFVPTSRH